jgi:hypothetical protein
MTALPKTLVRFRAELEDAIRRELEAQTPAGSNGWAGHVLRAVRRRPGRTTLAFAAVVGATAAAVLFLSTPWQSSPGFLERAQAALTPPPGRILHMKWEMTTRACTGTFGYEVWIDLAPPHMYRALLPPGPANPVPREPCATGPRSEVGGALEGELPLMFVPPNTLVRSRRLSFSVEADPWADVRKMISEGRAHREGATLLDGRTVERVRFDPPSPLPRACLAFGCPTSYGYFDPETLYPVAWDFGQGDMWRYLTYEYLPRTEDNLALTDIRAQHPGATGS